MKRYRADFVIADSGIVESGVLTIKGGRIVEVGTGPYDIDLGSVAVMPGLVNAHSHAFQRILRGRTEYLDSARPDEDFWSWRTLMYRATEDFKPDELSVVSKMAFLEMATTGITTVGEFHYIHHQPDGREYADPNELANRVIQAALDVGLRITLLNVAYHRGGFNRPLVDRQLRFVDRTLDRYLLRTEAMHAHWRAHPQVDVGFAPHSIRAVPADWLREIADRASQTEQVIHIHACEQRQELAQSRDEYQKGPISVLDDVGLLGRRTTLVHATHIDAADAERLARSKTGVCLCPTTEQNLGDGFVPAHLLNAHGVPICVGSDSQIEIDLWQDVRLIEYQQRLRDERRNVLARYVSQSDEKSVSKLQTASTLWPSLHSHGARALGVNAGRLAAGHLADFITVDLNHPSMAGVVTGDLISQLMFGVKTQAVRDVFVGGKAIVEAGRHPGQAQIVADYQQYVQSR
ncbi:MAG: formimidoylglutamate deiminase [Myxococcota bacterium]|nr:formimidoylglutamate deiminase [Myxococcota bacterium]